MFLLTLAFAVEVKAQSYAAILACTAEGQQQPDIIKISGTDTAPSWQHWLKNEHRWGENMCGSSSSSFGFTLAYSCRFSPGAYAYSFEVVSAPGKPEDNVYSSVPRIDRMTGAYTQTRRAYTHGQTLDREATSGTCHKTSEPAVPKPVL